MDFLQDFVSKATEEPAPIAIPDEPEYLFGNQRRFRRVDAPPIQQRRWQSLDEFRLRVQAEMRRYMQEPKPEHMLLIPAPPGSGKTWAGVEFAHWVYETTHHRVLYAGPRREFYADVLGTSVNQERDLRLWYDWKPRAKDDNDPEKHTCNHADNIGEWLRMGYEGMDFCKRVCGWNYIGNTCPYHLQRNRTEPLIYGHHLHVTLGHPMAQEFAVVIGDELPLSSFAWEWTLPAKRVQFTDIPLEYDLSPILFDLNRLCGMGIQKPVSGPDLLAMLGGAEKILGAINDVMLDTMVMSEVLAPSIPDNGNLDRIPANYLPVFLPILKQEAQAAANGQEYPHRLYVDGRGLTILSRRSVNEQLRDKHMVWFDATGTQDVYEAIFNRPVQTVDASIRTAGKFYQVVDRLNSKTSLLKKGEDGELQETSKAPQLRAQIDHACKGYVNPGVITYKGLAETIKDKRVGWFGGNRGTNEFEDCDVLVVAGTPMPPLYEIEKIAKCLWPERMRPFDMAFYEVERTYNYIGPDGEGYAYPATQFADPELNIILYLLREAEIEQAAHRSRVLKQDKPVFILSNLPVDSLPPARLLTIRELFDAPVGVNAFKWGDVVEFAECLGAVGTTDLTEKFGIDSRTARKYLGLIAAMPGWEFMAVKSGPGRPQTGIRKCQE